MHIVILIICFLLFFFTRIVVEMNSIRWMRICLEQLLLPDQTKNKPLVKLLRPLQRWCIQPSSLRVGLLVVDVTAIILFWQPKSLFLHTDFPLSFSALRPHHCVASSFSWTTSALMPSISRLTGRYWSLVERTNASDCGSSVNSLTLMENYAQLEWRLNTVRVALLVSLSAQIVVIFLAAVERTRPSSSTTAKRKSRASQKTIWFLISIYVFIFCFYSAKLMNSVATHFSPDEKYLAASRLSDTPDNSGIIHQISFQSGSDGNIFLPVLFLDTALRIYDARRPANS